MEKRAKYAKLHPEMSNLDLTKILSKKYKELPEKKKVGGGGLQGKEGKGREQLAPCRSAVGGGTDRGAWRQGSGWVSVAQCRVLGSCT